MSIFPDWGPREWSPRIARAFIEVSWLRAIIPQEFIVVFDEKDRQTTYSSGVGYTGIEALRVQFRENKHYYSHVWIHKDGSVTVERGICDLLAGKIPGLEHLAGTWDGVWPPPAPLRMVKVKLP